MYSGIKILFCLAALCVPVLFAHPLPVQTQQPTPVEVSDETALCLLSRMLTRETDSYNSRLAFLTYNGFEPSLAKRFFEFAGQLKAEERDLLRQFPGNNPSERTEFIRRRNEKVRLLYDRFLRELDRKDSLFVQSFLKEHKSKNVKSYRKEQ